MPADRVTGVINAAAGVGGASPAVAVGDAAGPDSTLPDHVGDLQGFGIGAEPLGRAPSVVEVAALREPAGVTGKEVAALAQRVVASRVGRALGVASG